VRFSFICSHLQQLQDLRDLFREACFVRLRYAVLEDKGRDLLVAQSCCSRTLPLVKPSAGIEMLIVTVRAVVAVSTVPVSKTEARPPAAVRMAQTPKVTGATDLLCADLTAITRAARQALASFRRYLSRRFTEKAAHPPASRRLCLLCSAEDRFTNHVGRGCVRSRGRTHKLRAALQ